MALPDSTRCSSRPAAGVFLGHRRHPVVLGGGSVVDDFGAVLAAGASGPTASTVTATDRV
jgi:hypothetical protein